VDSNSNNSGSKDPGSVSPDLPGRKLATSKIPRMLIPSEIALLQQDLKAALDYLATRTRR
jgi:hypothetical protein